MWIRLALLHTTRDKRGPEWRAHLIGTSRPDGAWRSRRSSDSVSLPSASQRFAQLGYAERMPPVKRFSYAVRDYAFGQAMLTLRTNLGLTQAGLADLMHVSRRAVAEWEAGSSYPK